MLKVLKLFGKKRRRTLLPNPGLNYRLVLRRGTIDRIIKGKTKPWKSYQEVGNALGFCRQYICMLDNQNARATPEFIARFAVAMGNTSDGWYLPFELIPSGVEDQNHPTWNQEKHMGRVPYDRFSLTAEFRKNDYKIEKNKKREIF